jgi:acyl-CoA synthetase (AMP-forming)/AMP-acid ligase II
MSNTVLDSLLARADRQPLRTAFSLAQRDIVHSTLSYGELLQKSLVAAANLAVLGMRRGDRVIVCLPTSEDLLATMFGVMLGGGVCVPVYPLSIGQGLERWKQTVRAVVRIAQVRGAVTASSCRTEMAALLAARREDTFTLDPSQLRDGVAARPCRVTASDLAFLQFTSGTTREPRGAAITHGALAANVAAIIDAIGLNEQVVSVSWLPPYHDMGLVGHVLTPVVCGAHQVLMPTHHFLSRPLCWLRLLSRVAATQTTAPNMGYSMCVHRIEPEARSGLDLSSLRQALVGAEPVMAETLEAFTRAYEPWGFSPRAFRPVYGLAEGTLAVAVGPPGEPAVDWVDRSRMREEQRAEPMDAAAAGAQSFVCVGQAVKAHEVAVVDSDGQPCAERQVGEIRVRGPSLMQDYFNDPQATREVLADGWLRTGDLGYTAGGRLYVAGRLKELIIKAGRKYAPGDIEAACEEERAIRRGRVVAFGVQNRRTGTEDVVVIAEARDKQAVGSAELAQRLTAMITERAGVRPDHVQVVGAGVLSKTSSGKLQRARVKSLWERGALLQGAPSQRWVDHRVLELVRGRAAAVAELGWSRARAWLNWR